VVKDEALFLADELEAPVGTVISSEVDRRAAAELRRLHNVNAELLGALKEVYNWCYPTDSHWAVKARAAITKAEGEKT